MKILISTILLFQFFSYSQSGQISGVIYSPDTTEVIPFTLVELTTTRDTFTTTSDINGKYKFQNLTTGAYRLKANRTMFGSKEVIKIMVKPNVITTINVYLSTQIIVCGGFCWRPPHAYPIGDENHIKIKMKDIKYLKTTEINNRVIFLSSNFQSEEGKLNIRGTRANNVTYYVDGIQQTDTPILPRAAIHSMSFHLGGVPAKYGNTTSGVILINTISYFDLYYDWKRKSNY